jgi:hypothetical protein
MSSCSVKILPANANETAPQKVIDIVDHLKSSDSSIIFHPNSKKPRKGFQSSSAEITDYGMKVKYILEKEVIIQTFEGDKQEYQTIFAECKFIKQEGILLISSNSAKLTDEVANIVAELLFQDMVVKCVDLDLTQEQLQSIIEKGARTVIEVHLPQTKGLDQIRLKAYDIQNKEWFIEEGFASENVERYTFIPNLSGAFAKKTVICNLYKNGRFVIYQKQSFGEEEIENIQFYILKMISDVLGSPLCKYGQMGGQAKLMM